MNEGFFRMFELLEGFHLEDSGELFFTGADCGMKCNFCSRGIAKRQALRRALHRALDAGRGLMGSSFPGMGSIPERFERGLSALRAGRNRPIRMSGFDILEYERVFELLDICRKHDRKIEIVSPGLKLADPQFCRRIAQFHPSISITCLSHRADTYARMTGRPDSKRLVERAMANMRRLGVEFSVNFVVTIDNYDHLTDVASFLLDGMGLQSFTMSYFSPEIIHGRRDPDIARLLVEFRHVNLELVKFAGRYGGTQKCLSVHRVPQCKVDEEVLACRNVFFSMDRGLEPNYPVYRDSSCVFCRLGSECSYVSRYYRARFPDEVFDYKKVNRITPELPR
ncbi:MAG: radical SAM protein [Pseudomonadota bacterium]